MNHYSNFFKSLFKKLHPFCSLSFISCPNLTPISKVLFSFPSQYFFAIGLCLNISIRFGRSIPPILLRISQSERLYEEKRYSKKRRDKKNNRAFTFSGRIFQFNLFFFNNVFLIPLSLLKGASKWKSTYFSSSIHFLFPLTTFSSSFATTKLISFDFFSLQLIICLN